jgi:hypothetical protein
MVERVHRSVIFMMKSQSAMEYLMTYGWAILIIAVVLSVLFQLGVFSSGNFQPHAQAGACQVSRTVAGVSLEGQCNGLLPQYVATFTGQSTGCPGSPNYVPINIPIKPISPSSLTLAYWIYISPGGPYSVQVTAPNDNIYCQLQSNECYVYGVGVGAPTPIVQTKWNFITLTINGGTSTATLYLNGAPGTGVSYSGSLSGSQVNMLGYNPGCADLDPASIANMQIYNATLSSAEINALYLEGIGGAPIRPQNLTGWWPLNSNANDYSGNDNNGATINVIYSSSWESGYTAP